MTDKFEQISIKPGFMKHNGGILFRKISDMEFDFKTTIDNSIYCLFIKFKSYI